MKLVSILERHTWNLRMKTTSVRINKQTDSIISTVCTELNLVNEPIRAVGAESMHLIIDELTNYLSHNFQSSELIKQT
jgi:hypothetical protein